MDTHTIPSPENTPELAHLILRNWHFVGALLGLIIAGAVSYTHITNMVSDLQMKQAASDQQANILNANFQTISPEISAINAKLDIIIRHDGL